jgi:hypothetical protein
MKIDFSHNKTGRYAIIENHSVTGYLVVEVIQRDLEGNVLRSKQTFLASGDLDYCQELVDKWNSGVDIALINEFEAWEKRQEASHE